jgi:NADH-quinone oxidoreductase subunit C
VNLEELKKGLSQFDVRLSEFRGEITIKVNQKDYFPLIKHLKEELGFNYLVDLIAVDEGGLRVVVHLYNIDKRWRIRVTTLVPEDLTVPSLTLLWEGANWLEREVYDLFGIKFDGHPNLKRILLWEGFPGHPLRKDYPVRKRPEMPEPK